MVGIGKYDTALQMFVRAPAEIDRKRVAFLRYLADHDAFGPPPAGPPSGPLAEDEPPGPWSAFQDEEGA